MKGGLMGQRRRTRVNGEWVAVRVVEIEQSVNSRHRGKWVCHSETTGRRLHRTERQLHLIPNDPYGTEETEVEWWKVPPDEDVMDGADLMQLLGGELDALIRDNELEVHVYQMMLAEAASEKSRLRSERWLEYHQARVRQLKHVHARMMTHKLPERAGD